MSGPVGNERDELAARAIGGHQPVEGVADRFDDLKVGPLVASAHIVGLAEASLRCNHGQRAGMVLDIEPVPDVVALAIDRQRFAFERVQDHQRDQLFGEMVGPVIVRAVGDDDRKAVGPVPGLSEVIGGCLRSRIRR